MRYRLLLLSLLVSGVAYAQSTPPVANDDTFDTPTDTLMVEAPGVLANDSDADGDSLLAVLVTGPSDGMLMLNPDGSFTYTPNAGFIGTDTFTYLAALASKATTKGAVPLVGVALATAVGGWLPLPPEPTVTGLLVAAFVYPPLSK